MGDEGIETFRLSPPEASVAVHFGLPERPHDDELTLFEVVLTSPGLAARTSVESLSGDYGVRPELGQQRDEIIRFEDIRLSGFLRELGDSPVPWDGQKRWRSLADELRLEASCDSRGHVTILVTACPRPWEPTWSASATLEYALGDLIGVADEAEAWFTQAE